MSKPVQSVAWTGVRPWDADLSKEAYLNALLVSLFLIAGVLVHVCL
jgi:hypothetical protein